MTRARRWWLAAALGALAAIAPGLAGCGDAERTEAEPTSALSDAQLDAAAWVQSLRSAHLAADADAQAGAIDRALLRLLAATSVEPPHDVHPDHARAASQDLWFRIAQLELRAGRPELALGNAERGLALGRARDLFTANLLIARGEALEAQGRDTEAASSYYEALQINAELLRKALGSPDSGAP